jgi:N-acetylglucosamine-6-sulfatase
MPLLHPKKHAEPRWRTVALVEHHGLNKDPSDPDFEDGRRGGNPTTYEAIRIVAKHLPGFKGRVNSVYVEYKDKAHELEYYDIHFDRFERTNIAVFLTKKQKSVLHKLLIGLEHCHNAKACWAAGRPR